MKKSLFLSLIFVISIMSPLATAGVTETQFQGGSTSYTHTFSGTGEGFAGNLSFPYGAEEHAVLFGISTIGGIMILKALFDMILNDWIEEFLLQRRIDAYWARKAREEENRKRVRDSFRQFQQNWNQTVVSPPNVYVSGQRNPIWNG